MLLIKEDYIDLEQSEIEIVERKGIGHPDTLADKLAEECSRAYSRYCLDHFGCILHYNIDKLYIGAGLFRYEEGKIKKYHNIVVNLNGRVSNTMNGEKIDLEAIFVPVIRKYLSTVMPRLDVVHDVTININCTQNTKREFWYSPRNILDVPDANTVTAGDTALCVAHGGLTFCENLALSIEQQLYEFSEDGYMKPKFFDIGQDIKFMISRIGKNVDITMCIPVLKGCYETEQEFDQIILKYQKIIEDYLLKIDNSNQYNMKVHINYKDDGTVDKYSLCIGSCIECGEEGIVGRGNNSRGIIPAFRAHTVEAPFGKNMRYHTGCVVDFMARNAANRIYKELGFKCSLYALTRNRNSLYEPYVFYVSVEKGADHKQIERIIKQEFSSSYLEKIVMKKKVI